jgi:Leucine-rich repeat (LRR) protein
MKMNSAGIRNLTLVILVFSCLFTFAQAKKKPAAQQKKPTTQQKKPASTSHSTKTQPTPSPSFQNQAIVEFRPGQIDTFQVQSSQLVTYFQGTLNFLADVSNSVRDKQTIITQSYLKVFWDPKVQIEDDLDENRAVSLYKDIPAYLSDVSFFFKGAKFLYTVQNVNVMKTPAGQTYFKVTANRNLKGLTINGDSVNSNKVRYIEINYNDSLQQLKIVSIYTTKLNERDDMRNWWNGLTSEWRQIFGKGISVGDTLHLNNISQFHDSVAMAGGQTIRIDSTPVFRAIIGIYGRKGLDVSGNPSIKDLAPVSKLSALVTLNVSNTGIDDLTEIRNLNNLENLDVSGTLVASLTPLKYAVKIKSLKMAKTLVDDLSLVAGFTGLELLDFSNTPIEKLDPIRDLSNLSMLNLTGTRVTDLSPVSGLKNLTVIHFDSTMVSDLTPLKSLSKLQLVYCDDSKVKDLEPLGEMTSLRRIYCDNTGVDHALASRFMQKHPEVLVIFESAELNKWWGGLPEEWKKVFGFYAKLDDQPTTEQLHRLSLVDSITVKGRVALTTLEPLKMLKGLRYLDAANTGITDLSPLADLSELEFINASNTKVASLDALKELKKLELLFLDNCQVSNLKALSSLEKLQFVYADNTGVTQAEANRLVDANPLVLVVFQTYENNSWWKNIPEEWRQVFAKHVKISGTPDKVDLQRIANLEKVTATDNIMITSLQPVVHLSRLKEINCSDTRLTSLGPLGTMKQLRAIRITKNPLTDLSTIAGLTGLTELDVSNTQVEELESIQNLTNLEVLKLAGTQVKNLKYLAKMTNLKVVEIYNTRVSSLDIFEPMAGLTNLKVFNTKVSEKKVEKFKLTHPGCEVVYY